MRIACTLISFMSNILQVSLISHSTSLVLATALQHFLPSRSSHGTWHYMHDLVTTVAHHNINIAFVLVVTVLALVLRGLGSGVSEGRTNRNKQSR